MYLSLTASRYFIILIFQDMGNPKYFCYFMSLVLSFKTSIFSNFQLIFNNICLEALHVSHLYVFSGFILLLFLMFNFLSTLYLPINTKKYHVFAPMGRFQLESIYLYFPPSSQLLYLCFCPVGLSLL